MKRLMMLAAVFCAAMSTAAMAAIQTEEVNYEAGGALMKGVVAWDDSVKGKRPAVLVVHEWWGRNDYAIRRARELAAEGYVAMAVDMYGGAKTTGNPAEAGELAKSVVSNPEQAAARFLAALKVLKKNRLVDDDEIGAVGYCFGGGIVLNMARRGVDLDAVVSLHGSLDAWAPAKRDGIEADILMITGGADPMVPQSAVDAFDAEMRAADADYRIVVYPGATHAFSNPDADAIGKQYDLPIAYDAAADKASWEEMTRFLAKELDLAKYKKSSMGDAPRRSGNY